MKESLENFRKAVNESVDLQEKIQGGADLVELGKENGHDFSQEDVKAFYDELQNSEEGLTDFELAISNSRKSPLVLAWKRWLARLGLGPRGMVARSSLTC